MNTMCNLLVSFAEVFAAMMAYNLIQPVKMASAKRSCNRREKAALGLAAEAKHGMET